MLSRVPFLNRPPAVAVLRLQGSIGPGARALNDKSLAPLIERAFSKGKPAAVALQINSPGGSPVQSSLIARRIRRLSVEKNVPVHAFVEDVAASGGYWIACAADKIWADPASIVGSIGVISAGFGLQDFIDRHGIERRVHTSGESKSQLDPFRPETPEDVARLEALLEEMHALFKAHVTERRAGRLADDPRLFTGEFWLADTAASLGLIDGTAQLVPKMKDLFGDKVRFRRYEARRNLLSRFGAQVADDALGAVEDRAAFARFGL